MDNYKEKWLDILNIDGLRRPPRAPKKAVDAMGKASGNPSFVKNVMQEWKEGKISDDDVCDRLKEKFGPVGYKKIEKAGMDSL